MALLDPDLYFPDGQIKGEVYEYGSFIQSRMFHEGVTCSDCHEPHSLEASRRWQHMSACNAIPHRSTIRRSITSTRWDRRVRDASNVICRRAPTWSSMRAATTASAFRGLTSR